MKEYNENTRQVTSLQNESGTYILAQNAKEPVFIPISTLNSIADGMSIDTSKLAKTSDISPLAADISLIRDAVNQLLGGSSSPSTPAPDSATSIPVMRTQQLAIGAGGWVTELAISPDGKTRVIRMDTRGAMRYSTAERRWVPCLSDITVSPAYRSQDTIGIESVAIAIAPSDSKRIYIAAGATIWRSDDGGESFAPTAFPTQYSTQFEPMHFPGNDDDRFAGCRMAVHPTDPNIVLFGQPATNSQQGFRFGSALWRTTDGGGKWVRVAGFDGDSSRGVLIAWDDTTPGRVIAASRGSAPRVSSDAGVSWTDLPAAGNNNAWSLRIVGGEALIAGGDGVLLALRSGQWVNLVTGATPAWAWLDLNKDPRTGTYYAMPTMADGLQPYRKRTGDAAFVNIRREPSGAMAGASEPGWLAWKSNGWMSPSRLEIDPQVPGRLWFPEGSGVWYMDNAETVNNSILNSFNIGIEQLTSRSPKILPNGMIVVPAWDFGVFRLAKGAESSYPAQKFPNEFISCWSVDYCQSQPNELVAVFCDHLYQQQAFIARSSDYGASWRKIMTVPKQPKLPDNDVAQIIGGAVAMSSSNPSRWVIKPTHMAGSAVMGTLDDGKTWSQINTVSGADQTTVYINYMALDRRIVADRTTPDRWLVWIGDPNLANSCGLGEITVSTDGKTFVGRQLSTDADIPLSRKWDYMYHPKVHVDHRDSRFVVMCAGLIAGSENRPVFSTDGGKTWTNPYNVTGVMDICIGAPAPGKTVSTVWIVGRVGQVFGLWCSTDRGLTWSLCSDSLAGLVSTVTGMDADQSRFGRLVIGISGAGWIYCEAELGKPAALTSGVKRHPIVPAISPA